MPRRKGPVELAALTAALLVAFQLSLTHWFYLYLPWVLPFVVLWLLLAAGPTDQEHDPETGSQDSIEVALPDSESESIRAPSILTSP